MLIKRNQSMASQQESALLFLVAIRTCGTESVRLFRRIILVGHVNVEPLTLTPIL